MLLYSTFLKLQQSNDLIKYMGTHIHALFYHAPFKKKKKLFYHA